MAVHLTCAVQYQAWREAPWLRVCLSDSDALGRVRAFQLTEAPHKQQLDSAIERWLAGDSLPKLEHPASYLLALRFSTVAILLGSLDGFFPPPPAQKIPGIYRTLLLEWWHKQGANYAVGHSCSGYDIFHKPEAA
jgi:hypothetical protein